MTWSYSGDPSASDLDAVRFTVGDTDTNNQLLLDAEINFLLTEEENVINASIAACERIAAKYSIKADKKVGVLSTQDSQKSKQYLELAKTLRAKKCHSATPYAGGLVTSDLTDLQADTSAVQPTFYKGQMDYN